MKLDKFHYHEALDRCDSVVNIIDMLLLHHPVIEHNKEFKLMVEKASEILSDLYQKIGEKA